MSTTPLVQSTCSRCAASVFTTDDFLDASKRGEVQNLCNRCYAADRKQSRRAHW